MGASVGKGHALAPDAKAFDQRLIPRLVLRLDVVEELPALRHKLEQTAARVIIFHMRLEMLGQIHDPLGQDRDLDLRRAGIARLQSIVFQQRLFALRRNRHRITSLKSSNPPPGRAASKGWFAAAAHADLLPRGPARMSSSGVQADAAHYGARRVYTRN